MTQELSKYNDILSTLKEKIRQKRYEAVKSVNISLLSIYHEIGKTILEQQKIEGWGTKIIKRLALDLKLEFPDMKGFSERNLKYMRVFAETYPDLSIVQLPDAQLQADNQQSLTIVQPLVAQLPWSHHIVILEKTKTPEERLFYIGKTIENNWSKNVLTLQIENKLFERQGKAITNFIHTLSKPQSDLAQETFKNPYIFDFLNMNEEMLERDLEKGLIEHLKKFMLELGRGFAYVGNQKNLNVEGDDFFLDLLFYNYVLKCFVIFELKVGEFKPEFAGKLNFYVNTVNEQLKRPDDKPTIGVLLCKTPNETVIKYSLKGIDTPIGVTDFELSQSLPKQLNEGMPTIEELKEEITKESENLKKPIDEKLSSIKEILKNFKTEGVKEKRNEENTALIFKNVLIPLKHTVNRIITDKIDGWFNEIDYLIWVGAQGNNTEEQALHYFDQHKIFNDFKISLSAKGFKQAGLKAFDIIKDIFFKLEDYRYSITFKRNDPNEKFDYLYHHILDAAEIDNIAELFCEDFFNEIEVELKKISLKNV